MTATSMIDTSELDRRFDDGEDLEEHFDMEHPIVRRKTETRRINLNMPNWLIDELDAEADRLAIPRQAVVVTWLADRAKKERETRIAL